MPKEFNESDHPRDDDGKFGDGGGSGDKSLDDYKVLNITDTKDPRYDERKAAALERVKVQKARDAYEKLQKEKEERLKNPTNKNSNGIDDDGGRIEVNVDSDTVTSEQIANVTSLWNDIATDQKTKVFTLNVGNPPKGHEKAVGNFDNNNSTMTISPQNIPGGATTETVNTIIHHELAHSQLLGERREIRTKLIETFASEEPVDSYAKQYQTKMREAVLESTTTWTDRTKVRDEMHELKAKTEQLAPDDPVRLESEKVFNEWKNKGSKKLMQKHDRANKKHEKAKLDYGIENHAAYTTMSQGLQPNSEQFSANFIKLKERLGNA